MNDVEKAISVFYHGTEPDARHEAHKYLLEIQRSNEGWELCWQLLNGNKNEEIQYYGAVILHSKLLHNFRDVSNDSLNAVKQSILELCSKYMNQSKIILNKLCTCFTIVTLVTCGDDFDISLFIHRIDNFFTEKGLNSRHFVIEFLTSLPQQFQVISLSSTQRINARTSLSRYVPHLFDVAQQILMGNASNDRSENDQNHFLTCLLAWIELGIPFSDAAEKLFSLVLPKVCNENLSDKAFEVLIELITMPSSFTCDNTIFIVLQGILQLEENIWSGIRENDMEFCRNSSMLLTSLGETHCSLFVKASHVEKQQLFFRLVKLLLQLTSIPGNFPVDETSSELTFSFWFTLQDTLSSVDHENISTYHKELSNVYTVLLEILFTKCKLPCEDALKNYTSDDKERLRCYRIDMQDAMLYIYTMLEERSIKFFCDKLQSLMSGMDSDWREYEVCFHLLKGIVEAVNTEDQSCLSNIIAELNRVPDHPKVTDSLILFLGSLADWLQYNSGSVNTILPFLLNGLSSSSTQVSCSIALKEICLECAPLFDQSVIPLIVDVCVKTISMQSTPLKVVLRLHSVCGLVLFAVPVEKFALYLNSIFNPLHASLRNSISKKNSQTRMKRILHYLNCYASFFQAVDESTEASKSIVPVVGELLPMLQFFISNERCNDDVIESISMCIEKALPLGENEHLVTSICSFLIEFFNKSPHGYLISTAAKINILFGKSDGLAVTVHKLFQMFTQSCLSLSSKTEHHVPDCMEHFMEYTFRTVKHLPHYIFGMKDVSVALVHCSIRLLNFQELPVIKKTCNFLAAYINESVNHDIGRETVAMCGCDIFVQCLACISGVSPRHTTDHFAEIILAINKHYVTNLAIWMNELFMRNAYPTAHVNATQKEQFRRAVLRERVNKRKLKEITKEFASACRGLLS